MLTFLRKQHAVFLLFTTSIFLLPLPGEARVIRELPKVFQSKEKAIALTFDDGPHPGYTERILALLEAEKAKATFFIVGKMAATYPYLVKKIAAQGHTIANHTHYHNNLTSLPVENMPLEWLMCDGTIRSITGKKPRFCRPPGGNYNKDVIGAATKEGLDIVLWTVNTADYTGISPREIEKKILRHVRSRGIVLLHDGVESTVKALPEVLKKLKKKGFHFVTLDEVFPLDAKTP